jgi:hypothetical protein
MNFGASRQMVKFLPLVKEVAQEVQLSQMVFVRRYSVGYINSDLGHILPRHPRAAVGRGGQVGRQVWNLADCPGARTGPLLAQGKAVVQEMVLEQGLNAFGAICMNHGFSGKCGAKS